MKEKFLFLMNRLFYLGEPIVSRKQYICFYLVLFPLIFFTNIDMSFWESININLASFVGFLKVAFYLSIAFFFLGVSFLSFVYIAFGVGILCFGIPVLLEMNFIDIKCLASPVLLFIMVDAVLVNVKRLKNMGWSIHVAWFILFLDTFIVFEFMSYLLYKTEIAVHYENYICAPLVCIVLFIRLIMFVLLASICDSKCIKEASLAEKAAFERAKKLPPGDTNNITYY